MRLCLLSLFIYFEKLPLCGENDDWNTLKDPEQQKFQVFIAELDD